MEIYYLLQWNLRKVKKLRLQHIGKSSRKKTEKWMI